MTDEPGSYKPTPASRFSTPPMPDPTEYEIAAYIWHLEQGLVHRLHPSAVDAVRHWVWAHVYLTGDPTKPKGNPQGILPTTDPPDWPNRHPSTWGRPQGTE